MRVTRAGKPLGAWLVDGGSGYDSQNDVPLLITLPTGAPVDLEVSAPSRSGGCKGAPNGRAPRRVGRSRTRDPTPMSDVQITRRTAALHRALRGRARPRDLRRLSRAPPVRGGPHSGAVERGGGVVSARGAPARRPPGERDEPSVARRHPLLSSGGQRDGNPVPVRQHVLCQQGGTARRQSYADDYDRGRTASRIGTVGAVGRGAADACGAGAVGRGAAFGRETGDGRRECERRRGAAPFAFAGMCAALRSSCASSEVGNAPCPNRPRPHAAPAPRALPSPVSRLPSCFAFRNPRDGTGVQPFVARS